MMTAAIIERKTAKLQQTGLSPVGFERKVPVTPLDGTHPTAFPYDDPQTVHAAIRQGLKLVSDLKAEVDHVGQGLLALGRLYGLSDPSDEAASTEDPVKVAEREADARHAAFKADFEAKQAEAQAQAFAAKVKLDVPAGGWVCPEHGADALAEKVSRRGRKYQACTECGEFEREVHA